MTRITESYLKVPYDLRPAKQVERRMLVDAFQLMAGAGFHMPDYHYTGMGSVYFVDFAIAHRYLGIRKLLSVEISRTIEKRVKFNRPFGIVEVAIAPVGTVIPKLSRDAQHILWLDYDDVIQRGQLKDVGHASEMLPSGSILLITVDAELPVSKDAGPKEWSKHYLKQAGDWLPAQLKIADFARSKLRMLPRGAFAAAIGKGLEGRKEVKFIPLFNFEYADGHRMSTIGGMIAGPSDERRLRSSGIKDAVYYRDSIEGEPFEIRVPVFTRKERFLLDQDMPCDKDWQPQEIESRPEDIDDYRKIYRFLPMYGELYL